MTSSEFKIVILIIVMFSAVDARAEELMSSIKYKIDIEMDYDKASYKGREVVTTVNRFDEEVSSLYFHLYPNLGQTSIKGGEEFTGLKINSVLLSNSAVKFSLREGGTLLKVDLPYKLQAGQSISIEIDFEGFIPRQQREESSLLAHFLQEVSDATSEEKQFTDARDIFFSADNITLMGYFYPMLVTKDRKTGEQGPSIGVSGRFFGETANYDVNVKMKSAGDNKITIVASAPPSDDTDRHFKGDNLRGFALVFMERMKSAERTVGNIKVVSWFREGDDALGRRALVMAASALEIYRTAFGEYPYTTLQVIELPLPAGYSGIEFPGIVAAAQAYYIDFDAPQAARLPGVLLDQADIIKATLEYTIVHGIAHQWWGEAVGSDSEKYPWLDESLASFSAVYYHEARYGKRVGEDVIDKQLRGSYIAYRMLGGGDMDVDKPVKDFKFALQYVAIIQGKGGALIVALRNSLGDEKFFTSLKLYYSTHKNRIASPSNLKYAVMGVSYYPEATNALFQRWLKEKHGDEDLKYNFAVETNSSTQSASRFHKLGRVFARIGRTAARPF